MLRPGDTVRTLRELRDIAKPDPLPAGTVCTVGRMYRIQDGLEIWALWLGAELRCADHRSIEPAYGPVQWRSHLKHERI